MNIQQTLSIILTCAALSGCASVARGVNEDVTINVTPSDAKITTSLGHQCDGSCTINVSRKKKFTVYAEKEGYEPASQFVDTRVSGKGAAGMAGNLLIGGVVGAVVDGSTGATLDHVPNPVIIKLKPKGAGQSTQPTRPRSRNQGEPTS